VTFEGEQGIVWVHTAAIVGHPDQAASAGDELDHDAAGIGVEAVLHQLLEHRGGTLDHLTRGDAVDQGVGKNSNSRHEGHHTRTGQRSRGAGGQRRPPTPRASTHKRHEVPFPPSEDGPASLP
jgi:hypothetical protein